LLNPRQEREGHDLLHDSTANDTYLMRDSTAIGTYSMHDSTAIIHLSVRAEHRERQGSQGACRACHPGQREGEVRQSARVNYSMYIGSHYIMYYSSCRV
jgi:hypothetical protein